MKQALLSPKKFFWLLLNLSHTPKKRVLNSGKQKKCQKNFSGYGFGWIKIDEFDYKIRKRQKDHTRLKISAVRIPKIELASHTHIEQKRRRIKYKTKIVWNGGIMQQWK